MPTDNVFVRKLGTYVPLGSADRAALEAALTSVRTVERRGCILAEGREAPGAHVVLSGVACRYKLLPDGRRQILDFLLPGDLCDGHALFLARMDHAVAAVSACRVAYLPRHALIELAGAHPRISRALWWASLAQESVAREWIVNVGARDAAHRVAHLLCELCYRLRLVGLGEGGKFHLPLTQTDLADATGLSSVHVNRILGRLKRAGLLTLEGARLTVPSAGKLEAFCGFDRGYLHVRRPRRKAA